MTSVYAFPRIGKSTETAAGGNAEWPLWAQGFLLQREDCWEPREVMVIYLTLQMD